jgi:hypothetical protein
MVLQDNTPCRATPEGNEPQRQARDEAALHLDIGFCVQPSGAEFMLTSVFNLEQARSREAERAVEAAEALMRGEKASLPAGLKTRQAIDQELRRLLPPHDPFWPRWLVSNTPRARRRA